MKKRYWFWVATLIFLATLLCSSGLLVAQAQEVVPEPPIVWPPSFAGLRIEYQRVNVSINEQVATTHIEQLFVNDNDGLLEGTYFFPLPEGAAVSQLTMWVDGSPIEAKILGRDEAREIYDAIVRQLRDPALLEYVGSSAIQANVFPIPPHAERRIEIEYTQILPLRGVAWSNRSLQRLCLRRNCPPRQDGVPPA
jgi:Ca-activated chloride channel family protein